MAGRTHHYFCLGGDVLGRPMTPADSREHPTYRSCPAQLSIRTHTATVQRAALRAHAEGSGWTWVAEHDGWDTLYCPRHAPTVAR